VVGGAKKEFGIVSIDVGVHKPDFSIIAIEHDCSIDSSVIDLTVAKELVLDFSLVAIDSLTVPEARSAIDAQLLLIQDRVNNGQMSFPDNFELLYDKNVLIFDTGASCNSSGCMDGAVNIQDNNSEVIPANGVCIKQDKIGDIPCSKLDKFGNHVNYTRLNSVKFGKQNIFNLFSANNAMQHNWMASGNCDNGWWIENEAGDVVRFDIRISTTTSCIWCGYFQRTEGPAAKELVAAAPLKALVAAPVAPSKPIKMPIMKEHDLLGHGDQGTWGSREDESYGNRPRLDHL
jgi:hypothetical protein